MKYSVACNQINRISAFSLVLTNIYSDILVCLTNLSCQLLVKLHCYFHYHEPEYFVARHLTVLMMNQHLLYMQRDVKTLLKFSVL
jgi:hypothetical protein